MYDLIGDIHGHCETLQKLLQQLGYLAENGIYKHPSRKIIFVGDYIDRGPQIKETLALVKSMVDAGHAIALMGNHEYNAVAYATPDGNGSHFRSHNDTHNRQHGATLEQFRNHPALWEQYLEWFRTLPLFLELDGIRAVHACWDQQHIDWLKEERYSYLSNEWLRKAHQYGNKAKLVVEETLKGKELNIPAEHVWYDKDGHARTANRIKWWVQNKEAKYKDFLFSCPPALHDEPVPDHLHLNIYPTDAPPVFVGHYWLEENAPALQSSNVVCLDYSVAKDGFLAAYRWDGEQHADGNKFVIARQQ
ncbi:MAG: phosphoesterase [Chitinophagaceae bacterium]|nr:MAG: phosphoesterase [Chitinophagaceae bacterium]